MRNVLGCACTQVCVVGMFGRHVSKHCYHASATTECCGPDRGQRESAAAGVACFGDSGERRRPRRSCGQLQPPGVTAMTTGSPGRGPVSSGSIMEPLREVCTRLRFARCGTRVCWSWDCGLSSALSRRTRGSSLVQLRQCPVQECGKTSLCPACAEGVA